MQITYQYQLRQGKSKTGKELTEKKKQLIWKHSQITNMHKNMYLKNLGKSFGQRNDLS